MYSETFDECFGRGSSSGIDSQFHLVDLFVDFIQESDDEVDQLVFVHLLRVRVSDQKTDVVTLWKSKT